MTSNLKIIGVFAVHSPCRVLGYSLPNPHRQHNGKVIIYLRFQPRLAALVPDYFYLLTQRRRGAECSTPTVGKRPPLPLRLALRAIQPLTRDFRRGFLDRIYKIDRIEKRELERCTPLATAYATRPAASWATQTHSRRRFAAARGRGES